MSLAGMFRSSVKTLSSFESSFFKPAIQLSHGNDMCAILFDLHFGQPSCDKNISPQDVHLLQV